VGAHVAAGIGDMIPNFGKGLLLGLDTMPLGIIFLVMEYTKCWNMIHFKGKKP